MVKTISESTRRMSIEQLECRRLLAINPTAEEQEVLQYINRFRVDPAGEFSRMFSSVSPLVARDSVLQVDLDFFKVNGSMLQSEWSTISPTAPVTWNEAISNFSANHNNSMISQNQLFHSDAISRRAALLAAGVKLDTTSGQRITSENVFGPIKSPLHTFAAYAVDWGTGSGGMEATRSHRVALVNPVFEEIGGKITDTSASNLKPKVNTLILANIQNAAVRVSGAVFEDRNSSGWYEAGEGLGGVSLSFEHIDGRKFSTSAFSAGGYQIELPNGTYKVRVTGGSMQHAVVRTITVNDKSQWQNFIYAANGPVPDANEPNDATQTATSLTAPSATQNSLSLHTANDVDFFKYVAVGTGIATYEIQFSHSAGNLDLQLLNESGQVLASSTSTGNGESIQFQVNTGSTYYLRVFGSANSSYTVRIAGPQLRAPIAVRDQFVLTSQMSSATFSILANDSDPDGSVSNLTPSFVSNPSAAFTLNADKSVTVRAVSGFTGVLRATYLNTDPDGLRSSNANIDVFVLDFSRDRPWQNPNLAIDVNSDSLVTASDALLVINFLTSGAGRVLPVSGSTNIFGFLDVNGNGIVAPSDALQVIDRLNRGGGGEGESALYIDFKGNAHDLAIVQMLSAASLVSQEADRRHRRPV